LAIGYIQRVFASHPSNTSIIVAHGLDLAELYLITCLPTNPGTLSTFAWQSWRYGADVDADDSHRSACITLHYIT
jgi:hypothetical protein